MLLWGRPEVARLVASLQHYKNMKGKIKNGIYQKSIQKLLDIVHILRSAGHCAFGAVELIRYFAMGRDDQSYSSSLVRGIILAAIGIFIIIRPDFIPKVIAVVCGLYMLISGIVNIQDSLNLRRAGVDSWNVSCISAAVTTLVGILLLFDPLILGETAMIVLGIALLVSGVTNIFGCFTAGSKLKKVNKLMKKELKDRPDKDHYIDI